MQTATAANPTSPVNDALQLSTVPPTHSRYPRKLCICLGAAQMSIGLLCIVCNLISILIINNGSTMLYGLAQVGHGFWCGTLFIVTGSIGIATGHRETKCKIVAYNVMSIISASFTAALLVCGVIGAVVTASNTNYCNSFNSDFCSRVRTVVAMESLLAVFAFIELILFILTSIICCKHGGCGNCCSNADRPIILQIICQQNTGQPPQGTQLTYFVLPTSPLQQGPTAAAHSQTESTLNQSQSPPPVAPLDPTAPSVDSFSRSRSAPTATYPHVNDGPIYDNYGIY